MNITSYEYLFMLFLLYYIDFDLLNHMYYLKGGNEKMKYLTCAGLGGTFCDFKASSKERFSVKDEMFEHLDKEHPGKFTGDYHLQALEKKMNMALSYQD